MRANARRARWLALAICVLMLAAALRFHELGRASLWYDEGNSWVQATRDLGKIAAHTARDIHPPGYYWLLAGARALFGESEFALRLPSALTSVLAAACLIAAGRRLGSWRAGIAAAALFAANSFALDYAQQARMYALHTLWGCAVLLATLAWRQQSSRGRLFALALLNAAGLWTQYSFAFVLLTQGIWLMVMAGGMWRKWLRQIAFLYALTTLLYLPWLAQALRSVFGWPNTGEALGIATALRELLRWFTVGRAGEYSPAFALLIASSAAAGLLVWGAGLAAVAGSGARVAALGAVTGDALLAPGALSSGQSEVPATRANRLRALAGAGVRALVALALVVGAGGVRATAGGTGPGRGRLLRARPDKPRRLPRRHRPHS